MPKYFFDIFDSRQHVDQEGVELADLATALVEAVRVATEVLKEMPECFWQSEVWTMTVYNASRVTQFVLNFFAEGA